MTFPIVPPTGDLPILPPEQDSSRSVWIMVLGILVTIFGGVAIIIVVRVLNPPLPAFASGDCVRVVDGDGYSAKAEKIDCDEDDALYEIGIYMDKPDGSCPSDAYSSYQQSGGRQQEFTLCFMLNATEGDCLSIPAIAMGEEKKVACDSDEANRRVTKIIDGKADKNACTPNSANDARVYPQPERTVCLGPVAT